MFGLAGQLHRGAQVRRGSAVTVQVDQGRGGQQGQPAAHHQKAAVLSQRRFGVEQPSDVAEIAAHPLQQDSRRGTWVGHGQVVHSQLQPLDRGAADLAGFGLLDEVQGGDLVGDGAVVSGGGPLVPAGRAVRSQAAQSPARGQPLIKGFGQLRGRPGLAAAQVGDVAGVTWHHAGQFAYAEGRARPSGGPALRRSRSSACPGSRARPLPVWRHAVIRATSSGYAPGGA